MCHYTFIQTHKMYKSELELKLWTLDDCDVSVQAHQGQHTQPSGGDVHSRRGWVCGDNVWEISVFSTQFCCGPETDLKNKV